MSTSTPDRAELVDRLRRWSPVAAVAGAAGGAAAAGSFAVAGPTPRFVVAPVASVVVDATPSVVVRYAITVLGDLGHSLAFATGVAATLLLLTLTALPGTLTAIGPGNGKGLRARGVVLAGLLPGLIAVSLTGAPVASLAAGVASAVVVAVAGVAASGARRGDGDDVPAGGRRSVLGAFGVAVSAGIFGLARLREPTSGSEEPDEDGPTLGGEAVAGLLSTADDRSLDVEGLEPLVSERFYNVDINNIDPDVDAEDWSLSIAGEVAEEREFEFEELRSMEPQHRFVSLRCVGDSRNGRKLDNALWTGVPMADLLEGVAPDGDCECVELRAADGYYQVFPVEALERGFLAYGMNGEPLPRAHGAPVRTLIPGHWGEINVKWLEAVEFLEQEAEGYWEKRGWHGTGPVNTVAKLWVENRLEDGRVEVAGAAYAGIRGVSGVEVSTDGGETWTDATLSDPLPGDDVWRQWAHRYDPPDGEHEVVVRAIEDDGTVQTEYETDRFPRGASGWVSKTIDP